MSAGANGDAEALSKLPDVTLAADARRRTALTAFQVRLTAIDPQGPDEDGKLNHAFLGRVIDGQLQAIAFDTGRLAFSSDDSWDGYIAYLAQVAPMTGKADAEAWLKRVAALPGWYACGEMLDWDAPTGGYLLTACFASGGVAGRAAASACRAATTPR